MAVATGLAEGPAPSAGPDGSCHAVAVLMNLLRSALVAAAVLLLPGPPALPEDLPCAEEQRTLCGAIAPGE